MRQIALSIFISLPAVLTAQTLSLEECLKLADAGNVTLQVAKASVDKARLMEGTAWDIGKTEPALSQDPTSGASPDNALSLSQTIDFPTRHVARRRQLKAETATRQSEAAVIAGRLHGQTAAPCYQLVYEREKLRILQRQDTVLKHDEDMATKRYDAGEVRQLEPLNASRLRNENQLELGVVQTEYANTQAELARLLAGNVRVEPSQNSLSPLDTIPWHLGLSAFQYSQTPEGLLADARMRAQDEAVKAGRTGLLPSFTVALRTQMVVKGWNPYHVDRGWNDGNFMGFEVGVGIPIFNGATRARVKAARKEHEQLALQVKSDALLRESQYTAAANNMAAARRRLDYYRHSGYSDAIKTADISQLAYESGEISYIEYVTALQQSIDVQLRVAAAVNDYNQAVIKLKTLGGIEI